MEPNLTPRNGRGLNCAHRALTDGVARSVKRRRQRQRAQLSAQRCAVSRTRALAVRKAPGKVSDPAPPDGSLLPDGQLATVHRPVAYWESGLCQRLVSQSFWEQNLKSQPSGAWVTWSIHNAR